MDDLEKSLFNEGRKTKQGNSALNLSEYKIFLILCIFCESIFV
jgi:hypothetical protein